MNREDSELEFERLRYDNNKLAEQLAQRDEQISAMSEILKYWGSEQSQALLKDTQAAVEAHNAKQQAIGREAGIREVLALYYEGEHFDDMAIEALLSKEPG